MHAQYMLQEVEVGTRSMIPLPAGHATGQSTFNVLPRQLARLSSAPYRDLNVFRGQQLTEHGISRRAREELRIFLKKSTRWW